mgnify:CR=1 FL=1
MNHRSKALYGLKKEVALSLIDTSVTLALFSHLSDRVRMGHHNKEGFSQHYDLSVNKRYGGKEANNGFKELL